MPEDCLKREALRQEEKLKKRERCKYHLSANNWLNGKWRIGKLIVFCTRNYKKEENAEHEEIAYRASTNGVTNVASICERQLWCLELKGWRQILINNRVTDISRGG